MTRSESRPWNVPSTQPPGSRGGRLQGKVAIVTGAGASLAGEPGAGNHGPALPAYPGTGQAAAIVLAQHGASVLLVDQNLENASKTLAMIQQLGGSASVFQADVTQSDQCKAMVHAAVDRYQGLHILVNNVGISVLGTVLDLDEAHLDRALQVNLKSMVLTCRHAIPAMIESGGGSIINMASVDGMRAAPHFNVPYAISKGGVISLTTCLAAQHGRQGIRANTISPGHIHAPMVAKIDPQRRLRRRQAAPLGTEGNAWDVANAVLFLASDEARWVSGVNLPVDGGLLTTAPLASLPFFTDEDSFES